MTKNEYVIGMKKFLTKRNLIERQIIDMKKEYINGCSELKKNDNVEYNGKVYTIFSIDSDCVGTIVYKLKRLLKNGGLSARTIELRDTSKMSLSEKQKSIYL